MTPHEEEMLDEIHQLQSRLAASERSRLLWKVASVLLCIALIALLGFVALQFVQSLGGGKDGA